MTPSELSAVLGAYQTRLAEGARPFSIAEELFETVTVAVSPWRARASLSPEAEEVVVQAVSTLLDCGARLFTADRSATGQLNEILKWARHVAGTLGADPRVSDRLDAAHREWNWRLGLG